MWNSVSAMIPICERQTMFMQMLECEYRTSGRIHRAGLSRAIWRPNEETTERDSTRSPFDRACILFI